MTINIKNSSSPDVIKNVVFQKTRPSGRKGKSYIEAKLANKEYDEPALINISTMGDLQLQDIPEFIKAIKLAAMIASGELEIE